MKLKTAVLQKYLTLSAQSTGVYIFILIAVSLWSVWPVVKNLSTSLPIGNEDIMITWIINRNIQKISGGFSNFFDGNIFYPYKNTIAYSEPFVTSAVLSYLPVKITQSYYTGFNYSLVLGQILTSVFLFLWLRDITQKNNLSFIFTLAFILSAIRMHYFVHIQLWNLQWFLASSWLIWKFSKSENIIHLYLAGFFLLLQIWESLLPVYWIVLSALVFLLPKYSLILKNIRRIFVLFLILFILAWPLISTYWSVHKEFDYQRSIRDAAHFSLSVEDLWGVFLSPGLYIIFFISFYLFIKRKLKINVIQETRFLLFSSVSLIMALGPVLKWSDKTVKFFGFLFIPLPYILAYYLVPGFGAFRTPSRWIIPFALGICIFSALVIAKQKIKYKKRTFLLLALLMVLSGKIITRTRTMPLQNNFPQVYLWLSNTPGETILEMPVYTSGDGAKHENELYRMLYSLHHKKNLVNGASGFIPPEREILFKDLIEKFPDKDLTERLSDMGVDYILVHKNLYAESKLDQITVWGREKIVYEDEETFAVKLIENN